MVVSVKCRGEPNFKQFEFKPNSQFKELFVRGQRPLLVL